MTKGVGRVTSIESARAKAEGGRKGMASRYGTDTEAPEFDSSFTGPFKSIEDYMRRLGPPLSWSDAKKMEEVQGEIILNEQRQTLNEVEKGKLLTADQVKARDDKWNTATQLEAEKVQRLCDGIDGFTPAMRTVFLERYKVWRKELGERLAKVSG